jgi:hypothetical protein
VAAHFPQIDLSRSSASLGDDDKKCTREIDITIEWKNVVRPCGNPPRSRAQPFSYLVRMSHGLNVAKTAVQLVPGLTLNVAAYAPVEVTATPSLSAGDVFLSCCSIEYPLPEVTVPE